MVSSDDDDDDDGDFGRPARAKKRRRVLKKRSSTEDSDDFQAFRISSRSGKATNYNEDDLYGDLSDLDDDLLPVDNGASEGPRERDAGASEVQHADASSSRAGHRSGPRSSTRAHL